MKRFLAHTSSGPSSAQVEVGQEPVAGRLGSSPSPASGYALPPEAGPAWRAASAEGLDLSLIELSLAKTPWARWREHDEALHFALTLRAGVRRYHG